ncbi:hypothetical protein GCM10011414_09990 [Croceivirga lutea]|uniref:hypothetical protein n=1 Tax=Croceivirga lutea TaxID=1775167 RepID=UPI00163AA276|nr:hypothetical protein [Croceivirga lutea]GGG42431.1 hypothetical protein GCM10011414_09990 [Croceivirga lutea]
MKQTLTLLAILFLAFSCGKDTDFSDKVQSTIPEQVQLVFPEENEVCTTGIIISDTESEVAFDWTDATNTSIYRVTLTNLNSSQQDTFEATESNLPIRLLRGTPYSWKVTTILENSEETTDSDTEFFYNAGDGVTNYIPFPASEPSPENGASYSSAVTAVNFSWVGSDLDNDIISYDFYFGLTMEPELLEADLESNILNNVVVNSGNRYYWQVVTKDELGNQSTSDLFYFDVN